VREKRVTDLLLILLRWMVAVRQRSKRILQAGWSAAWSRTVLSLGSNPFQRRLSPPNGPRRRIGWMTYCLEGLGLAGVDMEGWERTGVSWELMPARASRAVGRRVHPDLYRTVHFHHFLSCSQLAPQPSVARLGAPGRSTNLSMVRIVRRFQARFERQNG
jgi:hypothetical protein